MQTAEMVRVLELSKLFLELEGRDLETLTQMFELRPLRAGVLLYEAGQRGGSLLVVARGRVELSVGPQQQRVDVLLPPQSTGALSLLCPGRRAFTARAIEESLLLELGHGTLRMLETSEPELALRVLRALRQRAAEALDGCHGLLEAVMLDLVADG